MFQDSNNYESDVTRALPHALGPEKSLLSSMMQDPQEWVGVAIEEGMTGDHFYMPAHSILFDLLCTRYSEGKEIELVSLVQVLLDKGQLDRVGGPSAVTDLYTYAPSAGHFRQHLAMVKDKWATRQVIRICNDSTAMAYDSPESVGETIEHIETSVMALRDQTEGVKVVGDAIPKVLNDLADRLARLMRGEVVQIGIETRFKGLTKLGVTLKPGEMFVIAARPSMGKTAFMMNMVEDLVFNINKRCLVFSAEMTTQALVERLVWSKAKVRREVASGRATKGELQKVQHAMLQVMEAKKQLIIDDRSPITVGEIRALARRHHRDQPIDMIAIDYLQNLKASKRNFKDGREREVAEISGGIKSLAKELGIPIVLLAQLNRGPESRTGSSLGVPRMSDLRESGAIEQDADVIGLLYRAAYYAQTPQEKEEKAGEAKLVVAKHRNGETGDVPLTWIGEYTTFEDGEPAKEEHEQTTFSKSRYE